jgi:hypothetical protein
MPLTSSDYQRRWLQKSDPNELLSTAQVGGPSLAIRSFPEWPSAPDLAFLDLGSDPTPPTTLLDYPHYGQCDLEGVRTLLPGVQRQL